MMNKSLEPKQSLELVREFHKIYKQPIKESPDLSDEKTNFLRISLLQEELDELKDAIEKKDNVGVLDALTDIQYVLDGTYLSLGFHYYKYEALKEVHASNLSKLDENGKPIYNEFGKVQKGKHYFKPDLNKVIDKVNGYINMADQLKQLNNRNKINDQTFLS